MALRPHKRLRMSKSPLRPKRSMRRTPRRGARTTASAPQLGFDASKLQIAPNDILVSCECSLTVSLLTNVAVIHYRFHVRARGQSEASYSCWQDAAEAADCRAYRKASRAIYLDGASSIIFASYRK